MNRTEAKVKSTRDHLDAIFNARNVLSFVGEAIGQSREEFSESAHAGVYLIMESLRDDLESAGTALTAAIYQNPGCIDSQGAPLGHTSGLQPRASN